METPSLSDRKQTRPQMPARLLLVDDERAAQLALSKLLEDLGKVSIADSGRQGLRLAKEQHFDVILLDSDMPGMSGLEVCRALKADKKLSEIPVIFVTGDHSEELETRALEQGAADFLTKPVRRSQVIARVRAQLRISQASAARQRVIQRLELALIAGHLGTWDWSPELDQFRWHDTMGTVRGRLPSTVGTLADHLDGIADKERGRLEAWMRELSFNPESSNIEYPVEVGERSRVIRSRKSFLRDPEGRLIRIIGIDQDVTDWHQAAAQLKSANRQLEQFAYFASHDLQAPARQMAAFARIAGDHLDNSQYDSARNSLSQISAAGERLQSLVKSFLDLSYHRLAEPGEWRQSNMVSVVRPVLEDLRGEIQARKAIIQLGEMTGAYMPVNLVAHVWLNLILNALQHAASQPPEITIGQIDKSNGVAYYVENLATPGDGPASPLEEAHAASAEGHGLGLLICKNIVRVLGGRLWSEPGEQGKLRMLFSIERRSVPRKSRAIG